MLKNDSRAVIDEGLKHVHNDTCYPCLCTVGQYIDALKSGKYDVDHVAVLMSQSGGGCRASNYIPLIRKALSAEFPQVPVLSLNFSGLEKDSSFPVGAKLMLKLVFAIFYGDAIMWCYNQTKPYEAEEGETDRVRDGAMDLVTLRFERGGWTRYKKIIKKIVAMFAAVKRRNVKKVRVGIVGEIYVKYSSLGNNPLEQFLMSEDCEPVVPVLMDYVLYCVVNNINDGRLYGKKSLFITVNRLLYAVLHRMQKNIIKIFRKDGTFDLSTTSNTSASAPTRCSTRALRWAKAGLYRPKCGARRNGHRKHCVRPALRLPAQPHCRQRRHTHAQKHV